ncbi:hypothetical protein NDI54_19100 [Haloarcula sp. S1AR25-5A]|uniref:Uncharacterized protein n=1 Tax=Haloarcula terrestris TaxID=2950533 RepID=A0AAE4F0A2_9EURY|nr:hypothetical protein [Haloarcula terrestris]MDS0223451.1 hypothetical protein [Haloarcula terrestris]
MDIQAGAAEWATIDPWWATTSDDPVANLENSQRYILDSDWLTETWADIEPWWDVYATEAETTYRTLQNTVATLTAHWKASDSHFDTDPLSEPWNQSTGNSGPFRITHEEDWSQLLAYLCRNSAGPFLEAVFGEAFATTPTRVRREVPFHAPDKMNRRIDILVEYPAKAISIEIKVGDEHYGKTPDTAALIERHDTRDWTHVLLLPEQKQSVLQATFGTAFDTKTDPPTIDTSRKPQIQVLYWQGIARALRRVLVTDAEPSSHWLSTAYLCVALIEQKLLGFDPVLGTAHSDTAAEGVPDLWALERSDISAQLAYFDSLETMLSSVE